MIRTFGQRQIKTPLANKVASDDKGFASMTKTESADDSELKLCIDCRHAQLENEEWICGHISSLEHPPRSPVTGIRPPPEQIKCWRARLTEMIGFERRCGAKGRYWETRA